MTLLTCDPGVELEETRVIEREIRLKDLQDNQAKE